MTTPDDAENELDIEAALVDLATIETEARPELMLVAGSSSAVSEVFATRPTNRLVDVLRDIALKYAGAWSESELVPYSAATTPADGQIMWAAAQDVPLFSDGRTDAEAADLPLFDPEARNTRNLRLSVIRTKTAAGEALFYREMKARQLVSRASKIPLVLRQDRLDVIDGETLLIDSLVDAVVVGGVAFFEDRKRFQRIFGFLDELRSQAGATFDEVMANLHVANIEEMRAAATGPMTMLGKMASIAQKLRDYPGYREAITMEKLAAFVAVNPHTGVEIQGDGAQAAFVFQSDPQHRFKILKLLDDDYLKSQLTDFDYDANSKGMPLT